MNLMYVCTIFLHRCFYLGEGRGGEEGESQSFISEKYPQAQLPEKGKSDYIRWITSHELNGRYPDIVL